MIRFGLQPKNEKKESATIWLQNYFQYGDQHPKNGTVTANQNITLTAKHSINY